MSSLEKLNFVNHRNKCRCCFRAFDGEDDFQIKVSETVQNRFLELTQLKVRNFLHLVFFYKYPTCHVQISGSIRKLEFSVQQQVYKILKILFVENIRKSIFLVNSKTLQSFSFSAGSQRQLLECSLRAML